MRRVINFGALLAVCLGFVFALCCTEEKVHYGAPIGKHLKPVLVEKLAKHARQFLEQKVMVQGTVEDQDTSGNWLIVADESGSIKVSLRESGFGPIADLKGKAVRAAGTLVRGSEGLQIKCTWLEEL